MANTKDYSEREMIIDRCLSSGRSFTRKKLMEVINEELYKRGMKEISSRSTFLSDIREINSKYYYLFHENVIRMERVGHDFYYSYFRKDFSIYNRELTDEELSQIHNLIHIIRRFKGMPQFSWLEALEARFDQVIQKGVKPVVSFDDSYNQEAMKPFSSLLESIVDQHVVDVTYCKFKDAEPTIHQVSPHFLKQYQLRWYLLASYIGNLRVYTFALDRIQQVEVDATVAYEPTDVDFEHYFDDIIGITNYEDKPVENVEIRVRASELPYVLTKPLHHSQKLLRKEDNGDGIISIRVKYNMELKQAILSYGGYMEVIKPLELRREMVEQIDMMRENYEDNTQDA